MQGQTLGSTHDGSIHFQEVRKSHQELTKLVQTLGWTYGVVWKPTPDNRVLGWYWSWFNHKGIEEGKALELQFESVFRRCRFTQEKPGYAFRAWQEGTGTWWTQLVNRLPTDIHKEIFLQQANIQTIVCLPVRAPDGTTYCVELATNVLEPQSWEFQGSIQAFLNESVAPYLSSHLPASSLLQQEGNRMVGMRSIQATSSPSATTDDLIELPQRASPSAGGMFAAMGMQQGADSNPSTSSYSQVMMQEMEEEPFGGYGAIARGEQEYMSWTLPGSNYASAALTKEYTGFVDPPSNSAGDQSLHTDLAVFKEYTQMANSPVPNPVTVGWSSHQRSTSSSSTLETLLGQVHHLSPSGTLDVDPPHIMPHQGLAAGLESSQIQWNLDLELAAASGQFEAPVGNLLLQPPGGHHLVGIIPSQMPNPPADHHAQILNLYNLGGKNTNAQPQSFQASGSTISSHLPSTSTAPRDHQSFQFRHDSSRSPFRSFAQMDRLPQQQQFLSSSTSSASRLQGQPPGTTVEAHAKPQGHLIQTWVRNWQEKRWQQQQEVEVELGGEDARSPQTIARDEHQAVKHMRAERARRKIFNLRLQTLKSLVPIIHKKKDKVTVLSSTIDYIRHLTSSLENKAAGPLVLLSEQKFPADRPSTNITTQLPDMELAGGASSSISTTGPVIVEIEPALVATGTETSSSTSTTLVIRVEAQNHSRSLVHLLNILHDGFGLQLTNLDYRCVNDRFYATITIENPGDHNVSSIGRAQLRESLQRELAASPNDSPTTGSDLS